MHEPEWDDLKVFLAVARAGSMSAAARSLRVNQSTISRRLSALEDALGVRLVTRQAQGVTLTQDGLAVLASAQDVERGVAKLLRQAMRQQEQLQGVVRVACAPLVAQEILIPRMGQLFDLHPGLRVELITGSAQANLAQREADLALRLVPPQGDSLRAMKLFDHAWGFFASAAYLQPLAAGALSVERLDWLCYLHPQLDTQLGRWTQRFIPEANRRLVTHEVILLKEACLQGLGVAMLPSPLARSIRALVPVELELELPAASPIWLVAHEDVSAVPRIRAVWDFFVQLAQGFVEQG